MLLNSTKAVAWEHMEKLVIDCGEWNEILTKMPLELMELEDHYLYVINLVN